MAKKKRNLKIKEVFISNGHMAEKKAPKTMTKR